MTEEIFEIPLFPLNTVLFPGGQLPLRIFEPRYLDMISNCMKNESDFGICLIKTGSETGRAPEVYNTGTLCDISYFNMQSDGLLGITANGKQRFTIVEKRVLENQLILAKVQVLEQEPSVPIEIKFAPTVSLLESLFQQLGQPYTRMTKHYDCCSWVSSRLTELLPMDLSKKQNFLEMDDPVSRLEAIWTLLQALAKNKAEESA
jgi:hypothetical protein